MIDLDRLDNDLAGWVDRTSHALTSRGRTVHQCRPWRACGSGRCPRRRSRRCGPAAARVSTAGRGRGCGLRAGG